MLYTYIKRRYTIKKQTMLDDFQVVGHQEGLDMLDRADPLVLMVLLPAVPVLLVCWRALRWEDALLAALRTTCRKMPGLTMVLPFGE